MATVRLLIRGKVQGVFYRHSTREMATRLGLSGYVRNCPDGSVEAQATGARDRLMSLISWCKSGPPSAQVDAVDIHWLSDEPDITSGHQCFEIRR